MRPASGYDIAPAECINGRTDDKLERATEHSHHRWRVVALAAALLISVFLPTFALSATVCDLLGFTQPVLSKARLMVSAPVGGGRIVRV